MKLEAMHGRSLLCYAKLLIVLIAILDKFQGMLVTFLMQCDFIE